MNVVLIWEAVVLMSITYSVFKEFKSMLHRKMSRHYSNLTLDALALDRFFLLP